MENFSFIVKGKSYTTKDLKVGSVIDLWKMRTHLSGGAYSQMYRMSLSSADEALVMIDVESFFTVFCPDFLNDIKPTSIRELGIEDYFELKEVYVEQILPWMNKVEDLLKQKNKNA